VVVVLSVALAIVGGVGHQQPRSGPAHAPRAPVSAPVPTNHDGRAGGGPQTARGWSRRLGPDLTAHPTTDASSIWVVVNKTHPIRPLAFRPALTLVRGYQVARAVARPLARLMDAGDAAGLGLKIASAFRSYAYQAHVHDSLVASEGSAAADRVSARPGYSEHQTGLAVDLVTPTHPRCDFRACFATTPAGRWLAENAWRYGFLVRYSAGNRAITGYRPEPWHLRYVGRALAAAMRRTDVSTLEQVFHVGGGDYRTAH
jgi:D-alanyl-D-alanine carboxypeptidase